MQRGIIKKTFFGFCAIVVFLFLLAVFEIYVPKSWGWSPTVLYAAQKGKGDEDIARDLEAQGIIKSSLFFRLYVVISGQHAKLQAGRYGVSSSMSVAEIVKKIVSGDSVKEKITILEGWSTKDIGNYLEVKKIYLKKEFLDAAQKDFSNQFSSLQDKPEAEGLEGYLFPDTYGIYMGEKPEELLKNMLANFDKKMTPDLRKEIKAQHKSIFQVVTMASILEKEVASPEDKKIVAGILWKRLENGMPLQVDSTVNYITGKSRVAASTKEKMINSPYNTYKYQGLPQGPISNPGLDSILAAIYPEKTDYWYYLSASNRKTIFSKTFKDHNIAIAKYLN